MRARGSKLAFAAALLAGCASELAQEHPVPAPTSAPAIEASLDFGFDPLDPNAVPRVGDRIVAHVVAQTRSGPVERYVSVRLLGRRDALDAETAARIETDDTFFGLGCITISDTTWILTPGVLEISVWQEPSKPIATRLVDSRLVHALAFEGDRPGDGAYVAGVFELFETMLSVPELDALLMDVAKKPPLWTMLNGIQLKLGWDETSRRDASEPGLVEHDVEIAADDRLALPIVVTQGPNASPYRLVAGARRLEAQHPDDPELWARVEIVGARRGDGEPLYDRAICDCPAPDENGRVVFTFE
ncbi:MAG: hypothetical protein AAF726_24020 [Planctomycetota bacterium]